MERTILPATTSDNGNFILERVCSPQIQLLVEFAGHPDPAILRRALRLILDAQPVLGCRYVPRPVRPFWKRLSPGELDESDLLTISPDSEETLQHFLAASPDPLRGPQVRALLLQGSSNDRLVLKVNHHVSDAGGVKHLAGLLARTYRHLAADPSHRPPPTGASRSMRQVYRQFSPGQLLRIIHTHFGETRRSTSPYKSRTFPCGMEAQGRPVFVTRRLGPERVIPLRAYGRARGATLNDLLSTALLRAYAAHAGPDGVWRMMGTVDLRRYLPGRTAEAICNLSSFSYVDLGAELGRTFEDTLNRVKSCLDRQKAAWLGLSFFLGTWLTWRPMPFALQQYLIPRFFSHLAHTGNIPPSFTNMGPIDPARLDFGSPPVRHAELLVPPCRPPFIISGLSGFKDTLTLSMGFFPSAIPPQTVHDLFSRVEAELPGKCERSPSVESIGSSLSRGG